MRSRWLAGVSMAFPIPSCAVDAIPRAYSGLAAGRCNFYSFPEKYGFPEKSERRIGEIAGSSPAITGRPTGTALVVIVRRYPRKEDSTMKRRLALVAVLGGAPARSQPVTYGPRASHNVPRLATSVA